jgi:hypothetical protein
VQLNDKHFLDMFWGGKYDSFKTGDTTGFSFKDTGDTSHFRQNNVSLSSNEQKVYRRATRISSSPASGLVTEPIAFFSHPISLSFDVANQHYESVIIIFMFIHCY